MEIDEVWRRLRDDAELLKRERAARLHAEHVSAAKGRLIRALASRQRSRLNAAESWVALLRREHLDGRARAIALETVDKILQDALVAFDGLVDLARVADGEAQLAFARQDLRDVVRRSAGRAHFADPPDAPAIPVLGDRRRLEQMVTLLVEDAVACGSDVARIEVSVDGGAARLAVSPVRAQTPDDECFAHAIAGQLAEIHGGALSIEGDAAVVSLPLAREKDDAVHTHARVLVVSRDAAMREVLSQTLAGRGAHLVMTVDPDDASVTDALALTLALRR